MGKILASHIFDKGLESTIYRNYYNSVIESNNPI
jgi:hypothetical protein